MSITYENRAPVDWRIVRRAGGWLRGLLRPRIVNALCIAAFALMVLATAVAAFVKPEHNWDMAPYIAVSLENRIQDPAALHAAAWGGIRERVSDTQWYELSAGNAYNLDLAQNPDNFYSQLSMYRVKVGYTAALRFFQTFTDPVTSTMFTAAFAALLTGGLLLAWMVRHDFVQAAPFLIATLLLVGYFNMGMLATPDLLTAAFGLAGIYFVLRDRIWIAFPLLLAMYLVRPDGIIFLFALLLAGIAFGRYRLPFLALFAIGLALHFPISAAADHPGWWPHYYFSNIELQTSMEGFAPAFTVTDYLRGVMRGVSVSLRMNSWPMVLLVLLAGWMMLGLSGRLADRRANMMLVAIALCFMGKFVAFPLPDDRIYFMFVAGFAMILCEAWRPRLVPASADRSDIIRRA